MDFDYYTIKTVMNVLKVEDPGNCAIEGVNSNGEFFYLVIRTELGGTQIFEYGPTIHSGILEKSVICSFKRITYSDSKINKIIKDFLNNPYHEINDAKVITIEEALNNCDDMVEYMRVNHF